MPAIGQQKLETIPLATAAILVCLAAALSLAAPGHISYGLTRRKLRARAPVSGAAGSGGTGGTDLAACAGLAACPSGGTGCAPPSGGTVNAGAQG